MPIGGRVAAEEDFRQTCSRVILLQYKEHAGRTTLKIKINASDKEKVLFKCNEAISWLDASQSAKKKKFVDEQKELKTICNPIVTKLY
ncbi:Heat shock cognate 71 kDa protein [Cyphomyrmex costatus]|uniref:Heat shock cognate 71 kDa protein n=1 Tax=Cyphomyrmex costatus TaxID=456900 RepID=A0A151IAP4_9HYME|nr:Heat shock cognate 71 kDa protein [Cyphomyrmex costatus]